MKYLVVTIALFSAVAWGHSRSTPAAETYRELTLKIRTDGHFRIYMPNGDHQEVKYHLKFAKPLFDKPIVSDIHDFNAKKHSFSRSVYDKVFLEDESYLEIGGEQVPLTCVYVDGLDNRFSNGMTPLFPEFVMKIYLVANDYSCKGPIRKGWPTTGGKKDAWDTYLHYEVRDPTIMLPQDAIVRYRWNESSAVLIDEGQ